MKINNLYYTLTNGDIFTHIFGLTPTELWAMTEEQFLIWRGEPYTEIGLNNSEIDFNNKCVDIIIHEDKEINCFIKEFERLHEENKDKYDYE